MQDALETTGISLLYSVWFTPMIKVGVSSSFAGADIITIHYESEKHLDRTIAYIKAKGKKAAVALNPATPVHLLKNIIAELDMVLIMSVNPGFGGQKFIEYTIDKVKEALDF